MWENNKVSLIANDFNKINQLKHFTTIYPIVRAVSQLSLIHYCWARLDTIINSKVFHSFLCETEMQLYFSSLHCNVFEHSHRPIFASSLSASRVFSSTGCVYLGPQCSLFSSVIYRLHRHQLVQPLLFDFWKHGATFSGSSILCYLIR